MAAHSRCLVWNIPQTVITRQATLHRVAKSDLTEATQHEAVRLSCPISNPNTFRSFCLVGEHRVISSQVGLAVKQTGAEPEPERPRHLRGRHRERKPWGRLEGSQQRGGKRRKKRENGIRQDMRTFFEKKRNALCFFLRSAAPCAAERLNENFHYHRMISWLPGKG